MSPPELCQTSWVDRVIGDIPMLAIYSCQSDRQQGMLMKLRYQLLLLEVKQVRLCFAT